MLEMGQGEHVLVIDDVDQQRVLAAKMLEKLGYKVETAESGDQAIEILKKTKVDLLLLDMIMDPKDGLDTYREILKMHPGQKAIVVSGYSETERLQEVLTLGAGAFLQKPYNFSRFASAVRAEIDRK